MQLNLDCIRDVLLELETFPIGLYTVNSLTSKNNGKYNC